MKTFKFSFNGRQTGAIGINYQIAQEYKAATTKDAINMLFKDYEICRGLKLNGNDYEIKAKYLVNNYPYKGLGMLRK